MPEERLKREMSPVSDSDDSTSYHNVHAAKDKKANGHVMKSSADQIMREKDLLERELQEARRVALETAQNDLVASFGPLVAMGLPFFPNHHALFGSMQQAEPLSLKMTRTSTVSTNGAANPISGAGLNTNLPSGSSGGGVSSRTGGRDSPADSIETSLEPEDLSLRASPKDEPSSPKDLAVGDRASSGAGTPIGEDAGSTGAGSTSQAQNWSFEEQFKQLYELSDDSKRKEFLDDLFSYMQKRGTPVTRIPIMAKQVLDLYQLYKLVVAHGGLVEVINKKLWREITKGLNLPPSITSAAFTLRTQYMKFLYPFECERERLSSPSELQAAIDGNRREGRRAGAAGGYNPYSQISPTLLPRTHINGGGATANTGSGAAAAAGMTPDDDSIAGGLATPTSLAHHPAFAAVYREHLALEAHRHLERSQRNLSNAGSGRHGKSGIDDADNDSDDDEGSCSSPPMKKHASGRGVTGSTAGDATATAAAAAAIANSTAAAFATAQERLLALGGLGIPSAHFKITGRGDGRSTVDSSLVVSMEINGVMYQGVLFAQPSVSRLSGVNGGQ